MLGCLQEHSGAFPIKEGYKLNRLGNFVQLQAGETGESLGLVLSLGAKKVGRLQDTLHSWTLTSQDVSLSGNGSSFSSLLSHSGQ